VVIAAAADALNQLECSPRKAFAMEIPKHKQIVLHLVHDNVWQVAWKGGTANLVTLFRLPSSVEVPSRSIFKQLPRRV